MKRPVSASVFTENARIAVTDALAQAPSPADFLAQVDSISGESENVRLLPYDLGEPELLRPPVRGTASDAENGPAVFEYIGALDASNASDPRLWTFLSFNTYREYMETRWPLQGDGWRQRAETRWILGGSTRGKLVRHGIARLWWVTNLTYDAKCEYPLSQISDDPFAYTRAAFRNEDRINALFDREAGAIPSLTRAVLEHASERRAFARDKHVRAVMKELTLVMGFRDLGLLPEDALVQLIDEVRPRYGDEDSTGLSAGEAS